MAPYKARATVGAMAGPRSLTAVRGRRPIAAHALARTLRSSCRAGGVLLDLVLPPRCLACGEEVEAVNALCAEILATRSRFWARPCCACCGLPFAHELGAGALCYGPARRRRPAYDRGHGLGRCSYDDGSRKLILAFKHGDRLHGAPAFGEWMRRAGALLLADADLLIPVPLHWTRLLRRRYNPGGPARLRNYAREAGGPGVAPDWLPPAQAENALARGNSDPKGASAMSGAPSHLPAKQIGSGASRSCWWTTSSQRAPPWRNAPAF